MTWIKTLEKALSHHAYSDTEGFTLTLYFGKTNIEPLQDLARQLFEVFACPILLVEFRRTNGWHIEGIKSGALHKLREDQEDQFAQSLDSFSRKIWRMPRSRRLARYDLAILHDPQEALPPSNPKALDNFVRVRPDAGDRRRTDRAQGLCADCRIRRLVDPRDHQRRQPHLPLRQESRERRVGGHGRPDVDSALYQQGLPDRPAQESSTGHARH